MITKLEQKPIRLMGKKIINIQILMLTLVLVFFCKACKTENIKEKVHIIVFMDYYTNNWKIDRPNNINTQMFKKVRPIFQGLYPYNKEKFKPFKISIFPLYYNTAGASPIFSYSLDLDNIVTYKKGIIDEENKCTNGFKKAYKKFSQTYSNTLFSDNLKIIESVEVMADLNAKRYDKTIVLYISSFLETACDQSIASNECFNFYLKDGKTIDEASINAAKQSLTRKGEHLNTYVANLKPFLKDFVNISELYLFAHDTYNVKSTDGRNYNLIINFWKSYFQAIGFSDIYRIHELSEIEI